MKGEREVDGKGDDSVQIITRGEQGIDLSSVKRAKGGCQIVFAQEYVEQYFGSHVFSYSFLFQDSCQPRGL